MQSKTLKRTVNLIFTIFFLFVTLGMMRGSIQSVLPFTEIAGEIGFTFMTMMLTGIFAFLTVTE